MMYLENDQMVTCSNFGDIVIIEVMAAVQVIPVDDLIEPGTMVNNRLCFQ